MEITLLKSKEGQMTIVNAFTSTPGIISPVTDITAQSKPLNKMQ